MELHDAGPSVGLTVSMFTRLFRRSSAMGRASSRRGAVPPLSDAHRRQTDAVLACLARHDVLFTDEFELTDVYEHVRCNRPEDPDDPIGFNEVIGSVAHALDPLTNLVFIPVWSELSASDVEEFAESICWLAGINTSAVAESIDAHAVTPSDRSHPAGHLTLAVRFELDPGHLSELEVRVPPKGIPVGLIDGLAALLDDRLEPRRIVETLSGGDIVISALDPDAMRSVNLETGARYGQGRTGVHPGDLG